MSYFLEKLIQFLPSFGNCQKTAKLLQKSANLINELRWKAKPIDLAAKNYHFFSWMICILNKIIPLISERIEFELYCLSEYPQNGSFKASAKNQMISGRLANIITFYLLRRSGSVEIQQYKYANIPTFNNQIYVLNCQITNNRIANLSHIQICRSKKFARLA